MFWFWILPHQGMLSILCSIIQGYMLSFMNEVDPCLLLPLCVLYEIQNHIFQQSYHIQGINNKSRQKHKHRKIQANMWLHLYFKKNSSKQVCSSLSSKRDHIQRCMLVWMHDLPHLPCSNSAPMASMDKHMNACSWH